MAAASVSASLSQSETDFWALPAGRTLTEACCLSRSPRSRCQRSVQLGPQFAVTTVAAPVAPKRFRTWGQESLKMTSGRTGYVAVRHTISIITDAASNAQRPESQNPGLEPRASSIWQADRFYQDRALPAAVKASAKSMLAARKRHQSQARRG
ncbi:hypothetical protein PF003_g27103 [Phytophthora fragariae]|nr:hypothetical protein PF003_g27103 [Phytophthora fragariae]